MHVTMIKSINIHISVKTLGCIGRYDNMIILGDFNVRTIQLNSTLEALNYSCLNQDTKGFFYLNYHKCLSYFFPIHLNTYVMGLRSLYLCLLLQCGHRL